jgi:hypothetical protein
MLGRQLKIAGRTLIPLALLGWGCFWLLAESQPGGMVSNLPPALWWLGVVLAVATVTAIVGVVWVKARQQDNSRW